MCAVVLGILFLGGARVETQAAATNASGTTVVAENANLKGFSVKTPAGWKQIGLEEVSAAPVAAKLTDDRWEEVIEQFRDRPLVILTKKFPVGMQPCVQVVVAPLAPGRPNQPAAVLAGMAKAGADMLQNYKLVQRPTPAQVAGHAASYMRATYDTDPRIGPPGTMVYESWVLCRPGVYMLIGAVRTSETDAKTCAEMKDILKSLSFPW